MFFCWYVKWICKILSISLFFRKFKSALHDVLHHRSQHSTLCWTSIVAIFLSASCLLIASSQQVSSYYEPFIIIIILTANIILVVYDSKLKYKEIPSRVRLVLKEIKCAINNKKWTIDHFPNLCVPFSPCITLQWTYRDNRIVNVPWALLVKNDIVVIRAGQISPGYCEALTKTDEYNILHSKQVYGPSLKNANEAISTPKTRKPLENKKYRLIETPYLTNLKMALEQALDKPITHTNQQRYLLMNKLVEQIFFPMFLILVVLVNFVRYFYLDQFFGTGNWEEMFLSVPISVTLPLLPLVFPGIWIVFNCLGNAR